MIGDAGVSLGDPLRLEHQLAGLLGLLDLQAHVADLLAPRRALGAHRLERPHAPFVPRAPRLDALPHPHFFFRELLVELVR